MDRLNGDLLTSIIERVSSGRDRKSCSAVCKIWHTTEALTRVRLRIRVLNPEQIPIFLRRFANLTTLEINSMISDQALVFVSETCRKLQILNLNIDIDLEIDPSAADFSDEGLSAVAARCPDLRELSLNFRCNVTDGGIIAFQHNACALTVLDLSFCDWVTDASLAAAADMGSLSRLYLGQCRRVTDRGIVFILNGPAARSLRVLDVSACRGITDVGVCGLKKLLFLEELNLGACSYMELTDAVGAALASISGIQKLDLSTQEHITDNTLIALGNNCRNLAILDLSRCSSITDASLGAVAGMGSLSQLYLSDCPRVTNAGLDFLSGGLAARSLRVLDISSCPGITDVGVYSLMHLSCLEELMLCECGRGELTDIAGIAVASISSLKKLDLSMQGNITNVTLLAVANNCRNLLEICLYDCEGLVDQFSPFYLLNIAKQCPSLRLLKVDFGMKEWFSPSQLDALSGMCRVVWM